MEGSSPAAVEPLSAFDLRRQHAAFTRSQTSDDGRHAVTVTSEGFVMTKAIIPLSWRHKIARAIFVQLELERASVTPTAIPGGRR